MTHRPMAERIERARARATRRETLLILLNRADRLSAAEAARLVEHTCAELAEVDELRRTVQGQQTAMQALRQQLRAAEAAIVEVEAERDQAQAEVERMKLLVAASSEEGHAVRMAAQYAERAIENGKRAEQAEDLLRVAHETSNTSEAERAKAVWRARELEDRIAHLRDRWASCRERVGVAIDRAIAAEASLERVRKALHAINLDVGHNRGNSDPETLGHRLGLADAARRVRAALDEHQEQPATTPKEN